MDTQAGGALARWREQLDGWAIPAEILAAAPESPWGFPVGLFRSRARRAGEGPPTPSTTEAARHLPDGGSVLDVGAGAGAASLPLAGLAGRLVGVDESPAMVAAFLAAAGAAGVAAEGVEGRWPDVAGQVTQADVVVCHHVLYNVPDLAPFAAALTGHARRRVVCELTERHPLAGLAVDRTDCEQPDRFGFDDFDELVAFTRRRLCLPPARDGEVAGALLEEGTRQVGRVWVSGQPRRVTTLSWPGSAG